MSNELKTKIFNKLRIAEKKEDFLDRSDALLKIICKLLLEVLSADVSDREKANGIDEIGNCSDYIGVRHTEVIEKFQEIYGDTNKKLITILQNNF